MVSTEENIEELRDLIREAYKKSLEVLDPDRPGYDELRLNYVDRLQETSKKLLKLTRDV